MRIAIRFVVFFLFSCACYAHETSCYFLPPPDWQLADPKLLSPKVKVGFIGKNKKGFCPSLNLAEEEVDVSLEEYLQIVKKIYERQPGTRWRDLGKHSSKGGIGRLTEIDKQTERGEARLLQLMILKGKKVYILTAAASKEEFPLLYPAFQAACQSLNITDDLLSCMAEEKKKLALQDITLAFFLNWEEQKEAGFQDAEFQKKVWQPFQQSVINDCKEMGACWQILYLQEIQRLL